MYNFSDVQLTPITTETILNKISEYDIFKHYSPSFIEVNKVFNSDLREDRSPSCCIQIWQNTLLYKDFATGETYNCFGFVQKKFSCNFHECLRIIGADFGLLQQVKGSNDRKAIIHPKVSLIAPNTEIESITRPWRIQDVEYWGKYRISIELLENYNIKALHHVFVGNIRLDDGIRNPIYCYDFGDGKYKIYRPLADKYRWMSNTNKSIIQGYKQLPERGELLIIAKALKDVLVYNLLGYNAIAFQSETTDISNEVMDKLKGRFNRVVLNYDGDVTGVLYSQKISIQHNIPYYYIDDSKDVSDLIVLKGKEETIKQIQNKINDLFR